jgi:putative MATE family efflux protein
MRDLTKGPIGGHVLGMALFIGMGLAFQAAYVLIDLYFVSALGGSAVAGVSAAANVSMLVMAGSQLIAVGALALIAQAIGRRDTADANLVFNQAFALALTASALTLLLGFAAGNAAIGSVAADAATARFGGTYLAWFLPGLACMFPTAAMGSALRASGVVQPGMVVQMGSVALNAILAPVLIAGWGTGLAFGAAGAGMASSIANIAGLAAMFLVLPRVQHVLRVKAAQCTPRIVVLRRLLVIGAPAAGELFMMFVLVSVIYRVIRVFGPDAQAGFGIGSRIMQSIFLPAMAVSFAAAPVAGQNFGAGAFARVRSTFAHVALIGIAIMLSATGLCQIRPDLLVAPFTHDAHVAAEATRYLRIMSWNFSCSGLVFACSGMFQGLGDTRPSFISSASRVVTFILPSIWVAGLPGAKLEWIWYLSVTSVTLQAMISLLLLRGVFRRKLKGPPPGPVHSVVSEPGMAFGEPDLRPVPVEDGV